MSKFQGVKRIFLFVSFSLIITFGLLIHVSCAEAGGIGPNQGTDIVTLLAGQKAVIDVTQSGPFGMHFVGILSLGSKKLKSSFLLGAGQSATGLWLMTLTAHGGVHDYLPFDASFGLLSADEGESSSFNIERQDFLIVTQSVLVFSPVSSANPLKYTITISTDAL